MSKWHLVRHGATEWAASGRLQGQLDTDLTEAGRAQVVRLARRLAGVEFAAAYCSDLSRTRESARLLLGERTLFAREIPELREIAHGGWQGLTYAEVEQRFPEEYRRFMAGDATVKPGGGESLAELIPRLARAKELIQQSAPPQGNILVVSHGGAIRALLLALLGQSVSAYWSYRVYPAGLSIVDVQNGTGTIELWNDVAHLEASQEGSRLHPDLPQRTGEGTR